MQTMHTLQIIAHRGASFDYPENTELSFLAAVEQKADGVECDVRLTSCGTMVCIHDPRIDRVSDGTGLVSAMTYEQLTHYNFGTADFPQRPLAYDRLLEIMEAYPDKHLFIEAKHFSRFGRIVEEQLVLRLRYFGMLNRPTVHVISFSPLAMQRMRSIAPNVDRIFLQSPRGKPFKRWGMPGDVGASIIEAKNNPRLLPASYMWTVDEPDDMRWARRHGVRYMATNRPSLARQVLGRE